MEKMILKKFGGEQLLNAMNGRLNENKIKDFYQHIIKLYKPEIQKLYWGNIEEFIDLVNEADEPSNEQDKINITFNNGRQIGLSRVLFDFLFKGKDNCIFTRPIGERYENGEYIFMELIESPTVIVNGNIEKNGIFPTAKDENGNVENCFFIKSRKPGENYDYPKEIVPFFVSQMERRLKTIEDDPPSAFIDHFKPIKYVLRIKKLEDNLLIKLLYQLSKSGIVENKIIANQKIPIQQEMTSMLDDENNINLTNDSDENLDSLKFYILAIRNPNPYYRFLDAYHILESFFYKYFYKYVTELDDNMDKVKLYNYIKKHEQEQQMLKLVIENCLTPSDFQSIKARLLQVKNKELLERIEGAECNIQEWPIDNIEKFATKLSDLIYKFRNAIVHSKKSNRNIEKIEEDPNLIPDFIKLTNILLEIVACVLEKNINKW